MDSLQASRQRVLSGMRSTGALHLGHYHGVLKNWLKMQHEYECYFMVADWHAITTHYEDLSGISDHIQHMLIDWLAVGINPSLAHLFIQSRVPEHAELALLLGMMTPLSWLERIPSYRDQQQNIKDKDLSTYGFLGYPLLQAVDILIYKAGWVPVGEDQVPHVEFAREVARRFNHLYGRSPDFVEKAIAAIKKMGKKQAKAYEQHRQAFQERGDHEALEIAQALVESQANLNLGDRERLMGYLEGSGKMILPEPHAMLTEASKMPGLDGRKMSKSYGNVIGIREPAEQVTEKLRTMPTDPARVRRSDPGSPEKCPVWDFHQVYSDDEVKKWVQQGCTSAGIGCLECKQCVIDAVLKEQQPILERAKPYEEDPSLLHAIVAEGCEKARDEAKNTLAEVKDAMHLNDR